MTTQRSFLLLCGIGAVCFLSYNQVRMPALALFAESLGAGPEGIGLIVSVSTMTGVLLKLPSGALSDIYGRRALLRIGVLGFALPPFVYPFVSDLQVLTLLRAVHGLATALFAPAALATVAELYRSRRGEALGWYTASTQAGALIGPVLGGWGIYALGFDKTFVAAGIVGLLGALLFFGLRLEAPGRNVPAGGVLPVVMDLLTAFRRVAHNTPVLVTSITDAAKMIAKGSLMAFLPVYGLSVGLNAGEVGLLFGAQGLTSFLAKPVMGRLSDLWGRRPMIVAGLLLCAVAFGSVPRIADFAGLFLLCALFGLGDAVITSSAAALVADLSEAKALGAGMGMQGTITDIGHAAGPLLAGLLIAHWGYVWAFGAIAALQVSAALVFWSIVGRTHLPSSGQASG